MYTLKELNEMGVTKFIEVFGGLFEHSHWIAEKAAKARPFSSIEAFYNHIVEIVQQAPQNDQLTLIKNHPNLGDRIEMSDFSAKEQQNSGLKGLNEQEFNDFSIVNERYMKKFGFPFILAVRGKSKDEIYQSMIARIEHNYESEFQTALEQIYEIAKFRLEEIMSKGEDI